MNNQAAVSSSNEFIVTVLNDENDGDLSVDDLSLREAILHSRDGDTIRFDPRLTNGTIDLSLGELAIDNSLTIQGLGANNLAIDAGEQSRVFNIDDGLNNTTIDVTIRGLSITGGRAITSDGGGIRNRENLAIERVKISGNEASIGGGVSTRNSATTKIDNSTISGNSSNINGGGVAARHDFSLEINNSTITANDSGGDGSGVYFSDRGTITSSIITGNSHDDFSGSATSGGNNLIGKTSGKVFVDGVNADIVGTEENPLANQLSDLQDNGGSTLTHALLANSIAINAGTNPQNLITDQRGLERSVGIIDIGAVEAQAVEITNRIDGSDGDDLIIASNSDLIRGGNGQDLLNGLAGNDTLLGGQQFDRLNGGAGDDVLDGGEGVEVLTGGTGNDLFYLNDLDNIAWITDFELGRDTLSLPGNLSYDDLEITGTVNSSIDYQDDREAYPEGNRFAVLLGINSTELNSQAFTTVDSLPK